MTQIRVVLVCGSGAGSRFMASSIRKAATVRGIDAKLIARGESEIENSIDQIDALMVSAMNQMMCWLETSFGPRMMKINKNAWHDWYHGVVGTNGAELFPSSQRQGEAQRW